MNGGTTFNVEPVTRSTEDRLHDFIGAVSEALTKAVAASTEEVVTLSEEALPSRKRWGAV